MDMKVVIMLAIDCSARGAASFISLRRQGNRRQKEIKQRKNPMETPEN
jgi:hypothetical protein